MNHGGCRRRTATMVPHSRRQGIKQSADMLHNRSTSLKLDDLIYIIISIRLFSARCVFDASRWFSSSSLPGSRMQRPILHLHWTRRDAKPKRYVRSMFYCRGGAKSCLEEVQIAPHATFFASTTKSPSDMVSCRQDTAPSANHTRRWNDTNRGSIPWTN
jgi:hypothetical protein